MVRTFKSKHVYSNGVYDRLLAEEFPNIGRAAALVRQRLDFRGMIIVIPGERAKGWSKYNGEQITITTKAEERGYQGALEIMVHEAIHALGVRHEDNFRSHGGRRCGHGIDALSHCVAEIITGKKTFANMKFLHTHIGAFNKKLLRQIARIEAILRTQRKVENALGGCEIADLTDARMYRWQQMTEEQRRRQVAAMQVGRMRALGYEIYLSRCCAAESYYSREFFGWRCSSCGRECGVVR